MSISDVVVQARIWSRSCTVRRRRSWAAAGPLALTSMPRAT